MTLPIFARNIVPYYHPDHVVSGAKFQRILHVDPADAQGGHLGVWTRLC